MANMGDRRGAYRASVRTHDRKRPLGRPRDKWKYNIKMNLQEVEWGGMDGIYLAQGRDWQ